MIEVFMVHSGSPKEVIVIYISSLKRFLEDVSPIANYFFFPRTVEYVFFFFVFVVVVPKPWHACFSVLILIS